MRWRASPRCVRPYRGDARYNRATVRIAIANVSVFPRSDLTGVPDRRLDGEVVQALGFTAICVCPRVEWRSAVPGERLLVLVTSLVPPANDRRKVCMCVSSNGTGRRPLPVLTRPDPELPPASVEIGMDIERRQLGAPRTGKLRSPSRPAFSPPHTARWFPPLTL